MSRIVMIAALLPAVCIGLVLGFPLSLALDLAGVRETGLSALRVTGTVWNGRVERVAAGHHLLGDATLGLDARSLIGGDLRLHWRLARAGIEGEGDLLAPGGGGVAIADTRITGRLQALPTLIPLAGELRIDVERIAFGPAGCETAAARLWTDALARSRAHLDWRGPVLEGRAECRDGALVLPLAGRDDATRIALEMRLMPELRYAADLSVVTDNVRLHRRLLLLGFVTEADGALRLRQSGRLTVPTAQESS